MIISRNSQSEKPVDQLDRIEDKFMRRLVEPEISSRICSISVRFIMIVID